MLPEKRQSELDWGVLPDFLPETAHVRDSPIWQGARPAPGLVDRRVEITGPTDRKMVVNALNSDVWTYMADFEGMDFIIWLCRYTMVVLRGLGRLVDSLQESPRDITDQPRSIHVNAC